MRLRQFHIMMQEMTMEVAAEAVETVQEAAAVVEIEDTEIVCKLYLPSLFSSNILKRR